MKASQRIVFLLALAAVGAVPAQPLLELDCKDGLPTPIGAGDARKLAQSIPGVANHSIRVAYLIPTNRVAQVDAVYKLQTTVLAYQWWYRDQMERNGFGSKTFRYESEPDGVTPRIHVRTVNVSDEHLRGDLWGRTLEAATAAGVPIWASKQIWWLVPEAHLLNADGTLVGGTALGASFGSGDDAGVGMVGSDGLVRMKPEYLFDNRNYSGLFLPELGTPRMVQDKTFPWFEGTTISSVSSSIVGAGLHELSHAFGLPHNFRNDDNMHGNLMGNGLRGWRGAIYPDRYGADYARLSYGNALFLNSSRYFNSGATFTDQAKPTVTLQSPATINTTNGTAHIQFRASDAGGLAAAWLIWKGDLVDEMTLSGTISTQRFETPFFSTGAATEYKVIVIDQQGNRGEAGRVTTVTHTGNAAPQPKVKITPTYPRVGQVVTFDATGSVDPDHAATQLTAEWDYDGDGIFETSPSTTRRVTRTFTEPGVFQTRARLRDPSGAAVLSAPVGFRVLPADSNLAQMEATWDEDGMQLGWRVTPFGFRVQSTPELGAGAVWTIGPAARIWGMSNYVTLPMKAGAEFFRLTK